MKNLNELLLGLLGDCEGAINNFKLILVDDDYNIISEMSIDRINDWFYASAANLINMSVNRYADSDERISFIITVININRLLKRCREK